MRGRGPRGGSGGCVLSPNIALICHRHEEGSGVEGEIGCVSGHNCRGSRVKICNRRKNKRERRESMEGSARRYM